MEWGGVEGIRSVRPPPATHTNHKKKSRGAEPLHIPTTRVC